MGVADHVLVLSDILHYTIGYFWSKGFKAKKKWR